MISKEVYTQVKFIQFVDHYSDSQAEQVVPVIRLFTHESFGFKFQLIIIQFVDSYYEAHAEQVVPVIRLFKFLK